jgi:phosphoglycerate dehydrogenase-like enzyme
MLRARFPSLDFTGVDDLDTLPARLDAERPDAVLIYKHAAFSSPNHHSVVTCPSVRWVHLGGSGYEHMMPWDPARVTVTNSVGVLAPFLAETVVAAMASLNAGLFGFRDQQRAKVWRAADFRPLRGQTLLVVGVGAIGGHVADLAKAFGMRVQGVRSSGRPHPSIEAMHGLADLPALLGQADVVSLHVRLDEATRHLIDAAALAAMKPDAMLINTARGAVIDERALTDALGAGRLRAVYLDVFEIEPLPPSSPLWAIDRVLITPHCSDQVAGWAARFAALFADNLERWIDGRPLLNVVTPPGAVPGR